eukprot:COSAG05_NODE_136_length_16902_cov_21.052312_5_plen_69_part_00
MLLDASLLTGCCYWILPLDSMDALGNFLVGVLGLCGWLGGCGWVGIHLLYSPPLLLTSPYALGRLSLA